MRGGMRHKIARVVSAATPHVRHSISGFFLRPRER
jgi:hypothetical protein